MYMYATSNDYKPCLHNTITWQIPFYNTCRSIWEKFLRPTGFDELISAIIRKNTQHYYMVLLFRFLHFLKPKLAPSIRENITVRIEGNFFFFFHVIGIYPLQAEWNAKVNVKFMFEHQRGVYGLHLISLVQWGQHYRSNRSALL